MSRLKAFRQAQERRAQEGAGTGYWPDLCRQIDRGQFIPIISSAVCIDRIFDIDDDGIIGISADQTNPLGLSVEEELAEAWAEYVDYPENETPSLPKVAQYDQVVNGVDGFSAKTNYLRWLKDALLLLAEDDVDIAADIIGELRAMLDNFSFSDLAAELGYPKDSRMEGPLRILARLPLPIYVTTSCHDFIERALLEEQKNPRTQICYWNEQPLKIAPLHRTDRDLRPTPDQPLVYHVYGLEQYPETIVLSERDYLGFLRSVSLDGNAPAPVIPMYLRKALTQSSLCLLGYRVESWEFKALFRGIIWTTPATLRTFSLAVQLDPIVSSVGAAERSARDFVEAYFKGINFTVEWSPTEAFLETLWQAWQKWRS